MSYSNPQQITYTTGAITTTAGAATLPIRGPKGKQGRVVDIIARCTTSHVLGSTPTKLEVGVAGTVAAYASYLPPAMTAPAAGTLTDLPGASVLSTTIIPENTQVILTTTANAGGAPAGVITYDVIINWF
jgi:hypothetical protein